jgi:hypothetical protein
MGFPKVHRAPNGTYEGALSVLSSDLVLFLRRDTPSLELCRVSRGVGTATPPSLKVVRTLELPEFDPDYRVHTAYMQTDRHSTRRRRRRRREAPEKTMALAFQSAPEDMVVGITFLLRDRCARAHWKKVVTTVSHRALFSLASSSAADDRMMVRWEEWGPKATRIIVPSSFQWITAHAGQRWLSLESDNNNNNNNDKKLVIRDFSAARVRRASQSPSSFDSSATSSHGTSSRRRVILGNGKSSSSSSTETGFTTPAFAEPSVVVSSELPFIETCVDTTSDRAGCMVLTDGSRLVAFVQTVSFFFFFFQNRLFFFY